MQLISGFGCDGFGFSICESRVLFIPGQWTRVGFEG
jgi:hypothetical protein